MNTATMALMCAGCMPIPRRNNELPPDDLRTNASPAKMSERRYTVLDCVRRARQPITCPQIVAKTGLSASVCRKDLAYLKSAGLIESKRDGNVWQFTAVKK